MSDTKTNEEVKNAIERYILSQRKKELFRRGLFKEYELDGFDIKEPLLVTDEQYQEIIKYTHNETNKDDSGTATLFYIVALLILIIGSLTALNYKSIYIFMSSFLSFMSFFGIGKIIKLLIDIRNK